MMIFAEHRSRRRREAGRQARRAQAEQQGNQRAAEHHLRDSADADVNIAVKQRRDDREARSGRRPG